MKLLRILFIIILLPLFPSKTQAQLTLHDTLAIDALVTTLFGAGVEIELDTVICDTNMAIREFNGFNANLDVFQGLLMTTGDATLAEGPNTSNSTGQNLGFQGYLPLQQLSGANTFDACVIEFDVTPFCDSIGIRYVFASEEYNEFVASNFNDVFAFYISGPGFTAPAPGNNIALVPQSTTPVAINNVNNGNSPGGTVPTGPVPTVVFIWIIRMEPLSSMMVLPFRLLQVLESPHVKRIISRWRSRM
ncbi:MAG: choice-of-anchor L domain-containing protein [Bacteroidota bacterium]